MKKIITKTRLFYFIFTVGFLTACDSEDVSNLEFQSTEVNFSEIGKGTLLGNGQEGITQSNIVISNTDDWLDLVSQMDSVINVSDNFTEIEINFNEFTVFVVFLDLKGNGSEVNINSAVENETYISVSVEETEFPTLALTQAFHIIKIPITDKEIVVE